MLSFLDVENIGGFLVRSVSSCLEQVPATSTRPVCSRQWDPGLYIAGGWPWACMQRAISLPVYAAGFEP